MALEVPFAILPCQLDIFEKDEQRSCCIKFLSNDPLPVDQPHIGPEGFWGFQVRGQFNNKSFSGLVTIISVRMIWKKQISFKTGF